MDIIYTKYINYCSVILGDRFRILKTYLRDPKRISEISGIPKCHTYFPATGKVTLADIEGKIL